jgi:hypothetical protein
MNSPLSTGAFAVWPPTPRSSESRSAASETQFQFSVPEESDSIGTTAPSWDEPRPLETAQPNAHMSPDGIDIPSNEQYGSQIESEIFDISSMRGTDSLQMKTGVPTIRCLGAPRKPTSPPVMAAATETVICLFRTPMAPTRSESTPTSIIAG